MHINYIDQDAAAAYGSKKCGPCGGAHKNFRYGCMCAETSDMGGGFMCAVRFCPICFNLDGRGDRVFLRRRFNAPHNLAIPNEALYAFKKPGRVIL